MARSMRSIFLLSLAAAAPALLHAGCVGGEPDIDPGRTDGADAGFPGTGDGGVTSQPDAAPAVDASGDASGDAGPTVTGDFAGLIALESVTTAHGVAVDGAGDVVITGILNGTVAIDGLAYTPNGDRDVLVARFAANGGVKWVKLLGSAAADDGHGVALDGNGDVYVVGDYNGGGPAGATGNFGTKKLTAKHAGLDTFVAKLDGATGNTLWVVSFSGATGTGSLCSTVAVGPGPSVAVGCKMSGGLEYTEAGGATGTRAAGTQDAWVAELEPTSGRVTGGLLLQGNSSSDPIDSVAFDAANNLYVGGSTKSPSLVGDVPAFTLPIVGLEAAWLIKLTPGAPRTLAWSKAYGAASQYAHLSGVATGPGGSVYVTGNFGGTMDSGKGALTSAGVIDQFLLHVDPSNGATLHQTSLGGNGVAMIVGGVAVDDVGHPIVASGYTGPGFSLGSTPLPAAAGQSASSFAAKLTSDLSALAYVKVTRSDPGGVSGVRHAAIATHPKTGGSVVAGTLSGAADLGNGTRTTRSAGGAYVIRRAR